MSLIFNVALATKSTAKAYIWKDIGAATVASVLAGQVPQSDSSKTDAEAIQNSIRNLFSFRKGQRILLPEFGNSIYSIISNRITDGMVMVTENAIRNMLAWEPRITIINLVLEPYPDDHLININLEYSVPSLSKSDRYNINGTIDLQKVVTTIG